jgi:hypothetical protein
MITTNTPPLDLEWQAPSHVHIERSLHWYIGASIFVFLLFAYSIYIKAYTFTALLMLASAVYYWLQHQEPSNQQHSISKRGFMWGQQLMQWDHCKSFWIVQHQSHFELHITQRKFMFSEVCVHVPEAEVEAIFNAMSNYAAYDNEKGEGWLQYIVRISKL